MSAYPTDSPLDGRGDPTASTAAGADAYATSEGRRALRAVRNLNLLVEELTDALISCLVRLEDLNDGDGPTAQNARAALRRAGL